MAWHGMGHHRTRDVRGQCQKTKREEGLLSLAGGDGWYATLDSLFYPRINVTRSGEARSGKGDWRGKARVRCRSLVEIRKRSDVVTCGGSEHSLYRFQRPDNLDGRWARCEPLQLYMI